MYRLTEELKQLDESLDSVVLHGDPCLPNIIRDQSEQWIFVDLDHCCVANRHIDLAFAIWSLNYNASLVFSDSASTLHLVEMFIQQYNTKTNRNVNLKTISLFRELTRFLP